MKTAFVTGIGQGLGKELFLQLKARGHFVYGLLRNEAQYEELKSQLPKNAALILADVSTDECKEKIREIVADRPIDLIINNAGNKGLGAFLDEVKADEIMRLLQVHCLGVLRVVQSLKPNLLLTSKPVVLNLNSRFGSLGLQYEGTFKDLRPSYSYRIAKAAQNMLTLCMRTELGDKIEFVSLTPGRLITALARKDADLEPAEAAERIISFWERGNFEAQNGIFQVPDRLVEW